MQGQEELERFPLGASLGVFVSLAGVAAALTVLYLGMRSVMEIGGACAEGGPFVPARPCPEGVPFLMAGSIWVGLIFVGAYVWQVFRHGVPSLTALLWPALFLSLGWNFLEFGLEAPDGSGLAWGWLVCAAVFGAMGGIPLFTALPALWRRFTGAAPTSGLSGLFIPRRTQRAGAVTVSPWESQDAEGVAGDLVAALERLDALHRSGALDDVEYEAAKGRILGSDGR